MMILPTQREIELLEQLDKATSREEVEEIEKELRKEAKKQDEKLKDCLFAH